MISVRASPFVSADNTTTTFVFRGHFTLNLLSLQLLSEATAKFLRSIILDVKHPKKSLGRRTPKNSS